MVNNCLSSTAKGQAGVPGTPGIPGKRGYRVGMEWSERPNCLVVFVLFYVLVLFLSSINSSSITSQQNGPRVSSALGSSVVLPMPACCFFLQLSKTVTVVLTCDSKLTIDVSVMVQGCWLCVGPVM